ncbi:MAG: bifunctional demethylmenaquinone methyltransferase/2-methoxy-6-polyprenyl-1,4-benzoquinol methylase UbiE [Bacteroidales bacterium]|nr:bifunctional demethylmenaquinone methyltransferase/2-methoxy-6-polyprenyl-1,4-benzoquinol methylase UbiE [Bacteroidales bacterium]
MNKMATAGGRDGIGGLFDSISGTYDLLNHGLSFNIDKIWRRKAVRMLAPCGELLDVAVGTGDLAFEIIRQGKAEHVTGADLSVEMMRIGREKARARNMSERVSFEEASALSLPYADGRFDAVTCAFGVRNFSDREAGLKEMRRVLRLGGQLLVLEFSHPSVPLFRGLYNMYFNHLLPFVGGLVSGNSAAYRYLNRSVREFPEGEAFLELLRSSGFVRTEQRRLSFGIVTLYMATK